MSTYLAICRLPLYTTVRMATSDAEVVSGNEDPLLVDSSPPDDHVSIGQEFNDRFSASLPDALALKGSPSTLLSPYLHRVCL